MQRSLGGVSVFGENDEKEEKKPHDEFSRFVCELTSASFELDEAERVADYEKRIIVFHRTQCTMPRPPLTPAIVKMDDLLKESLWAGEDHEDSAAKKFLVDNMLILKEAGYTTLFMEHLFYEDQGELDKYFATPHALIPPRTKASLEDQDQRIRRDGISKERLQKYCFTGVLAAAKAAGIRVVGIDERFEYRPSCQGTREEGVMRSRQESMNFLAHQIITREISLGRTTKWIGFVGETHLKQILPGVLGVGELLGARVVHLRDRCYE
jgi:hypothetical protein